MCGRLIDLDKFDLELYEYCDHPSMVQMNILEYTIYTSILPYIGYAMY